MSEESLLETPAESGGKDNVEAVPATPDLSGFDSSILFGELKNRLPEELRHENLNSHKSFDTVAKSYIEKDKMIGQKAPSAPSDAKSYGVPEGFDLQAAGITDEELSQQQEYYKSLNIPEEQGKALLARWLETENSIMQGMREQHIQNLEGAKQYLSDTFGEELEPIKREVSDLVKNKLDPDLLGKLKETGALQNQYVIHALAEIAKDYRDDSSVISPRGDGGSNAIKEYETMKSDSKFLSEFYSKDKSVQRAAQKRWDEVSQKAYQMQMRRK